MEWLVDIEDSLDVVVAGVEVGERRAGIAKGFGVDGDGVAGSEVGDVEAEALGGVVVLGELEAGLGLIFFRKDEDEVTVERGFGCGDGNFNLLGVEGQWGREQDCEEERCDGSQPGFPF